MTPKDYNQIARVMKELRMGTFRDGIVPRHLADDFEKEEYKQFRGMLQKKHPFNRTEFLRRCGVKWI